MTFYKKVVTFTTEVEVEVLLCQSCGWYINQDGTCSCGCQEVYIGGSVMHPKTIVLGRETEGSTLFNEVKTSLDKLGTKYEMQADFISA